jgi:hypothetical protein
MFCSGFSDGPFCLQAYAPRYPTPKEENWYFILADPSMVRILGAGCHLTQTMQ